MINEIWHVIKFTADQTAAGMELFEQDLAEEFIAAGRPEGCEAYRRIQMDGGHLVYLSPPAHGLLSYLNAYRDLFYEQQAFIDIRTMPGSEKITAFES